LRYGAVLGLIHCDFRGGKIRIVVSFITRDAMMWWRRQAKQITFCNMIEDITTWEKMKEALITHFGPHDETWGVRVKVKFIKKTRSLQAHVREYSSLMLELLDMVEKDRLFNFVIGLQPWAQVEVKR